MTWAARLFRLLVGLLLVIAVVLACFLALIPWVETRGATAEEAAAAYPGDELIAEPVVRWTHGVTIDAPVEHVWPWVAQLGDGRGGFYTYTWIENLITGQNLYHNASAILPEFQNPQPGDVLIDQLIEVKEVRTGEYLLAGVKQDGLLGDVGEGMGWAWLWHLTPLGPRQTRLVVRLQASEAPGMSPGAVRALVNLAGWVMETRMLRGIRDRAEGYVEPAWVEYAEIPLWLAALGAGLWSAGLFLTRRAWLPPLLVGLCALAALFLFTYVQPSPWVRLAIDAALLALVIWAGQERQSRRVPARASRTYR